MRLLADLHLHEIAVVAEDGVLGQDFRDHVVRRADHEMPAGPPAGVELLRVSGGQPRSRPSRRITSA